MPKSPLILQEKPKQSEPDIEDIEINPRLFTSPKGSHELHGLLRKGRALWNRIREQDLVIRKTVKAIDIKYIEITLPHTKR